MTYLTTAEVAELKGITERHARRLCQSDSPEHMEKEDAANNRIEYLVPLTALTEKQQIKWENKKRSELGLEPVPLPCKAAPKPDPRQITLQDLTGDQRDNVGFWCEILQEWQRVRASRGENLGKCKVDELYCATIKLKYPNISISPDILYRKYKAYKDGNLAWLVDHRGGHNKGKSSIPQYMLDAFYSLYLHDNKLAVSRCYSLLQTWVQEHYPESAGDIPSERTFRRKAEALPYAVVMYMREGDNQVTSVSPFINARDSALGKELYEIDRLGKQLDELKYKFMEVSIFDVVGDEKFAAWTQDAKIDLKSWGGTAADGVAAPFDIVWEGERTFGVYDRAENTFTADGGIGSLTVVSTAGTGATGTILVVAPQLDTGNHYVYKGGTAAQTVTPGQDLSSWAALAVGTSVSVTGSPAVITVAEVDAAGKAVKAGSADAVYGGTTS